MLVDSGIVTKSSVSKRRMLEGPRNIGAVMSGGFAEMLFATPLSGCFSLHPDGSLETRRASLLIVVVVVVVAKVVVSPCLSFFMLLL